MSNQNPGDNGFAGPSSLTPDETAADAAITRKSDPVLDHVMARGSAYSADIVKAPIATSLGHRNRFDDPVVRVPTALTRK